MDAQALLVSFEQKAGRMVDLLPRAWQHAREACARAVIGEREFRSSRFQRTRWRLEEPVSARGARVGVLELCYLRELPAADEGPFLREERELLRVVAQCLGAACELHGI